MGVTRFQRVRLFAHTPAGIRRGPVSLTRASPLSAIIFPPDLQSVINTLNDIRRNHLHNPKVCLPLQPANELADCSVRVIKAKLKIKNKFCISGKGSYLCSPKTNGAFHKAKDQERFLVNKTEKVIV